MITNYVLGFVFDPCGINVLLMQKNKPSWQRNKFNGIGGKCESDEAPGNAMDRECGEELGEELDWQPVCELVGPEKDWIVHVYAAYEGEVNNFESQEEEQCYVFPVTDLPDNVIPNVRWLVPMALSLTRGERAQRFRVEECI